MAISIATPATPPAGRDALQTLRAYHGLAPWSLRDLSALAGTLLEASGVVPVNVAARARPSERTIRFYVMKGLVDPPEGRGTAAVYRYRHLLQVLGIKLRQMEGVSLEALAREFADQTGDMLERRVAAVLGPGLPAPDELGALQSLLPARGRSARALRPAQRTEPGDAAAPGPRSVLIRRVAVAPGAELALEASHPLFRHVGAEEAIARAVAAALDEAAANLDSSAG
jgi:DNA-binding transcriptional MerR regulator